MMERGTARADDPGEPSTGRPRVSITDAEAAFLRLIGRMRSIVEIGTGLGISTCALADQALTIDTVDIDPWVQEQVWPQLPGHVRTFTSRDDLEAEYWLAFIDGDHRPEQFTSDLRWALARAKVIVCHDWIELGSYAKEIVPEGWIEVNASIYGMGMLIR